MKGYKCRKGKKHTVTRKCLKRQCVHLEKNGELVFPYDRRTDRIMGKKRIKGGKSRFNVEDMRKEMK